MREEPKTRSEVIEERDELRQENEQLRQRTLEDWVRVATSEASVPALVHQMEASLSWRVTKPLRTIRSVQLKAAQVGYLRALSMSRGYLRRALGNRRPK